MAESVDALVSNTSGVTPVPVRPRLWVHLKKQHRSQIIWFVSDVFYFDNLKTHFFSNNKLVFFENYKSYSIHTSLLITVWIVVENFVKKSGQKIWILVTCLAYTAILIFQIFCPQFIFLLLHNFSRLFVDYFSRILLTLQVVNSLLITYAINYQSIFKVVNNLLITNNETLITQKSSIFEKSFQLY